MSFKQTIIKQEPKADDKADEKHWAEQDQLDIDAAVAKANAEELPKLGGELEKAE